MLDRMLLASTASEALYVEDVFSTWLFAANGSTQTITNGIDLSGKGGAVWLKSRSNPYHGDIYDTARGATKLIYPSLTDAQSTLANGLTSFNSNGFALGPDDNANYSVGNSVSWTFRKAPKFFDVVTYTGTGATRTIAHSLGVAPGAIIVKRTDTTADWVAYNRGLTSANNYLWLNRTDAQQSSVNIWNGTAPTSTEFSLGSASAVNASGGTYVAYLFAHDATSDGIIQCGSFTTDGSGNATVNLGYEPQWLMAKCSSLAGPWVMTDIMRGMTASGSDAVLLANSSGAETTTTTYAPTATGFTAANLNGSATYVYIAIRRGPMKTPTVGTSVFKPTAISGTASARTITGLGFSLDLLISKNRDGTIWDGTVDRLRGTSPTLNIQQTAAETSYSDAITSFNMDGYSIGADTTSGLFNGYAGGTYIHWAIKRAPGFFDVVCYTGTGVARTINHSLGVAPELMIVKRRNVTTNWQVYSANLANTEYMVLNSTAAKATGATRWNSTTPTSTVFTVGTDASVNASGGTYVAYLFASCPGVSKVGSYTGNGSSQTINCGFSSSARFFLVKRTDSTGDWWVYDSARGIVAANDPALRLNSIAAEVTSADAVDTDSTGIIVNQETTCNINVNGATYIYLAIA